jgi:hypothetical protein
VAEDLDEVAVVEAEEEEEEEDAVVVAVAFSETKVHRLRLSKLDQSCTIVNPNSCVDGRSMKRCPTSTRVCTWKTNAKSAKWMRFLAKCRKSFSPSKWIRGF